MFFRLIASGNMRAGGGVGPGAGMINMGNTCYLNSTLQVPPYLLIQSLKRSKDLICANLGYALFVLFLIIKTLFESALTLETNLLVLTKKSPP
jgi:hypothetical protein